MSYRNKEIKSFVNKPSDKLARNVISRQIRNFDGVSKVCFTEMIIIFSHSLQRDDSQFESQSNRIYLSNFLLKDSNANNSFDFN